MTGVFAGRARNTKHHQYYQFCSFVKDIGKKNIRTTRSYEPCFKARKLFSITRNNFSAPLLIAVASRKTFLESLLIRGKNVVWTTTCLHDSVPFLFSFSCMYPAGLSRSEQERGWAAEGTSILGLTEQTVSLCVTHSHWFTDVHTYTCQRCRHNRKRPLATWP